MQGVKQSLEDILNSREERVLFQQELIKKFKKPIVSYKLNIPGPIKSNSLINEIFNEGVKEINDAFDKKNIKILYQETFYKNSGPELFICFDKDPEYAKKLCMEIEENHDLGRLYDFDILDYTGVQIGRQNIYIKPRRCLICNKNAFECSRSRSHSLESLLSKIEDMANSYFEK